MSMYLVDFHVCDGLKCGISLSIDCRQSDLLT